VLPSVVLIQTADGLGSGVVFDGRGDIVTNAHVVGSAKTFHVTPAGGTKALTAKLVGVYAPDDLAVVRVENAGALRPATFGDSGQLVVGDIVLAIGNPLGLASSVTNGIVSAVGRTVTEPAETGSPGATLPDTIQTSAAINPGNSGGALVDLQHHVVGIPTLAATDQQLGGAAPGIGFAISSNTAKDIATQLIDAGKVTDSHRAALGVTISDVTDNTGAPAGAGIYKVTAGGAAARAALRAGDVITSVANKPVTSSADLSSVLAGLKPGQVVPVTFVRDGATKTVQVTLQSLPGS
jgi:putative serine protease PepD